MTRDELEAVVAGKMSDENVTSSDILNTIYEALKEPTRDMKTAWDDDMSDWMNEDIEDPWHPWVCMLNASPLNKGE